MSRRPALPTLSLSPALTATSRTSALMAALALLSCQAISPAPGQTADAPPTAPPLAQAAPRPLLLAQGQRILLFGDSITATGDYGQVIQDALDEAYPKLGITVLSRGSHGDTAERSVRRIQSDIAVEKPDWVAVKFGTNDVGRRTPAEFEADLSALLDGIRAVTPARLVIVSAVYPDRAGEENRLRHYLPVYQRVAQKYGALYAPVYETLERLRPTLPEGVKYAPDGSHPNAIGHQVIGQTLLQTWGAAPPNTPIQINLPAVQATAPRSDAVVGTGFQVDLPQPLKVNLTPLVRPVAQVKWTAAPIVLNGKLDEWRGFPEYRADTPEQRTWGVISRHRPHVRASLRAACDETALYLAIEVHDRLVYSPANPPRVIDRDWVELCLDLRPIAERLAKPEINLDSKARRAGQLIISAPGDAPAMVFAGTGDPTLKEGVTVAGRRNKKGYNLEIRIPASAFPGGRPLAEAIGLDWGVVDLYPGTNYLGATSFRWTGSGSSSFSTREFGELRPSF